MFRPHSIGFLLFLLLPSLCIAQEKVHEESYSFSPDRPGMATGPSVLPQGKIIWETGIEGTREDEWSILLPTTMFRFGLSSFAELRLEYDGVLLQKGPNWCYEVAPLVIGTKLKFYEGKEWIPAISFLANLSIPCTKILSDEMSVAPSLNLLFQNDICRWFNINYNVGASWDGINTTPTTFLALCLGFNPTESIGLFLESFNYLIPKEQQGLYGMCNMDVGGVTCKHPCLI